MPAQPPPASRALPAPRPALPPVAAMAALVLSCSACAEVKAKPTTRCDPHGLAARSGAPTRCEAQAAMLPLMRSIAACSDARGIVTVSWKFAADGVPLEVMVLHPGEPAGQTSIDDSSVLECVSQKAEHARLPHRRPYFRLVYPFRVGPGA